jgi:hypothetical protein
MLEMSSGMEECEITGWARDNMPLAHAGILHSSMPEMSGEGLIFFTFFSILKGVSSILHSVIAFFFHRVNLRKIP